MLAMFKTSPAEERTQILYRAFSRSGGKPRSYAGYVTPQEAQRLAELGAAKIVDLRTAFEREYVGHVPDTLHVEWLPLGSTEPNPGFVDALRAWPTRRRRWSSCAAAASARMPRPPRRQRPASAACSTCWAASRAIWTTTGQRGTLGGWRKAGLPWKQG